MYLEQINDESHEYDLPMYDISKGIDIGSNEVAMDTLSDKVTMDTLSDNLWNVLIRQCQTELNLTVTEPELRYIVVNTGVSMMQTYVNTKF